MGDVRAQELLRLLRMFLTRGSVVIKPFFSIYLELAV